MTYYPPLRKHNFDWDFMNNFDHIISSIEKYLWEKLYCEKTSLFYDRICKGDDRLAELPTLDEISKQFPNPCGWSTGMEDCSINAGHMLEILSLQHTVSYENISTKAKCVIKGIHLCQSVHGKIGFLVRGVSPFDKKSCYFNSSRDQITMVVGGLFDIYKGVPTLPANQQEQIKEILFNIATYTKHTVTKENNYSYLRLDGGKAVVSDLWNCDVHEMLRLPMIYAAAGEICKCEEFSLLALSYMEEGLKASEAFDKEKYFWDFPLVQMQLSLHILLHCPTLKAYHKCIKKLMKDVAFTAKREFLNVLERCEAYTGDWNAYCNNWRTLPMYVTPTTIADNPHNTIFDGYTYLNPAYNKDFAIIVEYLRSLGNYLVATLLAPEIGLDRADINRFKSFLSKLDFSQCTHAGPFSLLHGLLLLCAPSHQKNFK